jgi:hypothetical protein
MSVHRLIDTLGQPLASTPECVNGARGRMEQDRARALAGQNAHNVVLTALALALAKYFIVAADDATAQAFVSYFNDQSRNMAAALGMPAIAAATEEKTSQLAGMLLAKRAAGGRQRTEDR